MTLILTLSPLTTVVLEPVTSVSFFTSVQPVLVVRARVTGASNRQMETRAVTAPVAPATVTASLVRTVFGSTLELWPVNVKLNAF